VEFKLLGWLHSDGAVCFGGGEVLLGEDGGDCCFGAVEEGGGSGHWSGGKALSLGGA
jgi:hypothetical protein